MERTWSPDFEGVNNPVGKTRESISIKWGGEGWEGASRLRADSGSYQPQAVLLLAPGFIAPMCTR